MTLARLLVSLVLIFGALIVTVQRFAPPATGADLIKDPALRGAIDAAVAAALKEALATAEFDRASSAPSSSMLDSGAGAGAVPSAPSSGAGAAGTVAAGAGAVQRQYYANSLIGGRVVRTGCDLTAPAAVAASESALRQAIKFERRLDIIIWLADALKYRGIGVELGVKQGEFAAEVLKKWKDVSAYHLVDPWVQQEDYADIANVVDAQHDMFMHETEARVAPYGSKVHIHRAMSFDAVKEFDDCSLDFVYVDAVHDYEGALRDIVDWWPKLKPGGILAGHDYLSMHETTGNPGIFGVKPAVDRFAMVVDRPVTSTEGFPTVDGHAKGATARGVMEWASFVIIK